MIKQDREIFCKLRGVLSNCLTTEDRKDYLDIVDNTLDISKTSEMAAMIADRFWKIYPEEPEDYELSEYYLKRDALLRLFIRLTRTMKASSSMGRCKYISEHLSKERFQEVIDRFS